MRFCFVESDPQSFEELSAFAASKRSDNIEIVVLKGEFEENLPQIRQFLSKAKGLPFRFLLIDPGLPNNAVSDPLPLMGRVLGRALINFYLAFAFTVVVAGELPAQGFLIPDASTPTPTPSATPGSRLGNLSTRAFVQTGDNVMIGGFIVQGTEPKRVIIRAIGPELIQYRVADVLVDPTLDLYDGTGALIASNDSWLHTIIGGIITSDQVRDIRNSGHAPTDARESAIIADLPAGNYTAIVRGVNNTMGVALVEVYDLSPDSNSILGNISTRSFVQTDDNVMIGGFMVQGIQPKRVILRAIGPELSQYGVPNVLPDPTLELHDSSGALIASNDDWQHTIIGGIITDDQVREIRSSGYAPRDRRESAIIAELPPGSYTGIVRGKNIIVGVALVEVYDLDE